ncbi:hypothetical protein E2P81_ATG06720 [Venturia nashicola]|nr:hypothetical protein E2P81_ATG06720 [Venturia nashicola]
MDYGKTRPPFDRSKSKDTLHSHNVTLPRPKPGTPITKASNKGDPNPHETHRHSTKNSLQIKASIPTPSIQQDIGTAPPPPNNQDNEKHRPNTTPPTPKRRFKCFTRHRDRDGRTDGLVLARRRASSTCNDILRRTAYTPSSSLDNASHAVEDLCGLEYIQQPWLECRERDCHIYKIPAKAVCLSDILINDMTGNNNHHDFHLMHAT